MISKSFQTDDMERRRNRSMEIVLDAIEEHGGTTLLSTGITADDARLAKAVVDRGVKLLEPNHPALALARGVRGVVDMHSAEAIRQEVPLNEMLRVIEGVRAVVGTKVFITAGIPGGFTELDPVRFEEDALIRLAIAGANGVHTHKTSLEDLEIWSRMAHEAGLTVDAYIGHSTDRHPFGIPAETPQDVREIARKMEDLGIEMIGLMTGMSYGGISAGAIHDETKRRLDALNSAVTVPTLAEGGINIENFNAFADTGVNIIVVGTSFDDAARRAVADNASVYLRKGA